MLLFYLNQQFYLQAMSTSKLDREEIIVSYSGPLSEKGKFRISPSKNREISTAKKISKPFASSLIQEAKLPTKEELLRINSKIQLIKSRVLKKANKSSKVRKTQNKKADDNYNNGKGQEELNESIDMESEFDSQIQSSMAYVLRSRFKERTPTLFFHYPKCCGIQTKYGERVQVLEKADLTYKISGSEYKCIVNTLEQNGFRRYEGGGDWNIFFDITGVHQKAIQSMNRYQKMNHFPGCWQLGRKDCMWKNLNKRKRVFPQAYNFVPITYIFPHDFDRFEMLRETAEKGMLWIMKPSNAACGRGIKMIGKETSIKNKKDYLVSEYIANPHTINGFKYDLRVYVLVTSYDPLRIYMLNEGLTRFATYQYSTKSTSISKRFVHLTNFSVNKHSKKFVKNSKAEKDGEGSKWSFTALRKFYNENGIDSTAIFNGIKDVIIKTCISAEPVMLDIHSKSQQRRNCGFQIYGFDILIDNRMKPWLMEVNVCPSLSSSSPMDRKIKHTLLTDTLNIIGMQYCSKKSLERDKKKDKLRHQFRQDKKYYSRNIKNLENLCFSNCVDILSPEDWQILFQSCEQLDRCGNFQCIFPLPSNISKYENLFEFSRYNNQMLWKYLRSDKNYIERLYEC